jgi:hypothetical protein
MAQSQFEQFVMNMVAIRRKRGLSVINPDHKYPQRIKKRDNQESNHHGGIVIEMYEARRIFHP